MCYTDLKKSLYRPLSLPEPTSGNGGRGEGKTAVQVHEPQVKHQNRGLLLTDARKKVDRCKEICVMKSSERQINNTGTGEGEGGGGGRHCVVR